MTDKSWYNINNVNEHLAKEDQRMDEIARNGNDGIAYQELGESYADKVKRITADGHDPVLHPNHYCSHPSGVECIQITEHMNFNLGNAVKYIWRADLKDNAIIDLEKAKFYIEREIALRSKA